MRLFLVLLVLVQPTNGFYLLEPSHPNCHLVAVAAPKLPDVTTNQAAARAFAQQTHAQHTLLFVRTVTGRSTSETCVLVVQRSATHFTRYTYQQHRVDSIQLVLATWPPLLARLGRGHYAAYCESISLAPTLWVVLVKQRANVRYSLHLTDYAAADFTFADKARLQPALALVLPLQD